MRLFIAIEPLGFVREYLDSLSVPGARAKKHITLKFLGEVNESMLQLLISALEEVRFKEFELKLEGLGFFPGRQKPRVIWAGVKPWKQIIALQRKIEGQLVGFPHDSRFYPHITLSRIKPDLSVQAITLEIRPLEWNVSSFSLIKSTLKPKGPDYETIKTFISNT